MMSRFQYFLDPLSCHKNNNNNIFKVGHPLAKHSGSAHEYTLRAVTVQYELNGHLLKAPLRSPNYQCNNCFQNIQRKQQHSFHGL